MSKTQRVIKYLALAFATFLIIIILSAVLSGFYFISLIFESGTKDDKSYSDNITSSCNLNSNITYLDIDLSYIDLNIETGEDFSINSNAYIKCNTTDDKITISEKKKINFSKANKTLVISIPSNYKFKFVDIDTGVGKVNINSITTDKLELDLGTGVAVIDNLNSYNTSIDSGAGKVEIKSGNIGNLDFDIATGKVDITAFISGNSKIDSGIGQLNLNLLGKSNDYRLMINKGIGSIKLNNSELSDNSTIGNGVNHIDIDGGIGNINIKIAD